MKPDFQEDIVAPEEPEMEQKPIHTVELDNLSPIKHRWVDRGLVLSCEGAGHPNHQSFKLM